MGIRLAVALLGLILTPSFITAGDIQYCEDNSTADPQVIVETVENGSLEDTIATIIVHSDLIPPKDIYHKLDPKMTPDIAKSLANSLIVFVNKMPGGEEFTKTWSQDNVTATTEVRAQGYGGDRILITITDWNTQKKVEFTTLRHDKRNKYDGGDWVGYWNHTAGSWW